jgi:ankyrin repeat protein
LPETLDETYERTLREINKADSELAHRLFQCVAVASRPLRVQELAEFLAFDFSARPIPQFREDWHPEDPVEAVLSTCSTLLSLVDVYDSQVIQFSHFSVKEFLMSSRFAEKRDPSSCRYHISMTPAHTLVAQACLGILSHLDMNVTRDCLRKFPLAKYAAEQLVKHARFEGVSENVEEGLKQLFDGSKPHLAVWLWIYNPFRKPRAERPLPPPGTALHYAAFCGFHAIVKFLAIEHSEDVHSRVVDGGSLGNSTPLDLASREGHVEAARVLVEHGADVTAQDEDGLTPLHQLSRSPPGKVDVARFLVEHGADVTAQDNHGSTALHQAVRNGSVDLARLLIEHSAGLETQDKKGWTALHLAVAKGSVDLARLLVQHGADVNAQDNDGSTALHRAVMQGSVKVARFLVEHGADTTARDHSGWTPLNWTLQIESVDLARLLIEHGTDTAAPDNNGWTPLHLAVQRGRLDFARLLIEHGVDVTARDNNGWTPLHRAVQQGSVNLARLLVEHGADVIAQDDDLASLMLRAVLNGSVGLGRSPSSTART